MVLMSAIRAANTETGSTDIIIICCIAGLIIALLLGAIITWFVRARRRTNRSGSPQLAALPRRNQAQGIVRAMLNTLPIVKFDDTDDGVKTAKRNGAKRDVEMSLGTQNLAREHSPAGLECIADNVQPNPSRSEIFITNQPSDRPTPTVPGLRTDTTPNGGNFSCPICTDDFVKSQDLRILPCNHQFHLGCIDPWLVNVSGTCPLCRIGLISPQGEENAEQNGGNIDRTNETSTSDITNSTTDVPQDRQTNQDDAADEEAGD